jgi:hypothetical protein
MASYFPLYRDTGSISVTDNRELIDFIFLTSSFSASYNTTVLPDPFIFYSNSLDISNALSATSSSLFSFSLPTRAEKYYYTADAIIGVRTSAAGTGVRIGLQRANNADGAAIIKVASTLTGYTLANIGTGDGTTFALPASMAAANTKYPAIVKGVYANSTTASTFNNQILLQPETNNSVTADSRSIFYTEYAGYFLTGSRVTASYSPLYLSAGTLDILAITDTITGSVLPSTSSLWLSQSLAAQVSTTNTASYSPVFIITNLTNGAPYLVNFYIIGRSAATGTGVQIRAVSGSFFNGSIYVPSSATAIAIQNSAGGTDITNLATAFPAATADRLIWGEYTFIANSTSHSIEMKSEINASAVSSNTGSVIFYRRID